ncbi:MAG: integrase, partial [Candidatus Omnitrophica bacterium CG23_combo_of_CG06-09_8_20_14_all_41_10]
QFTRSRPYHKDDNAHIEQKNWTQVRQWLGYSRFDNPAVVPLLNDLFRNEWNRLMSKLP